MSWQNEKLGRLFRMKIPKLRNENIVTLRELFVIITQTGFYYYFLSPILLIKMKGNVITYNVPK